MFADGAQSICHVPVDLKELRVDAYFSNFHKWGFSPVNSAFLYVSDKYVNVNMI